MNKTILIIGAIGLYLFFNKKANAKFRDSLNMSNKISQDNILPFLRVIQKTEGTANMADPFAVCFGYKHTIKNFSDHPAITGEWRGEKLSSDLCKKAGFASGNCVSTAAGAYQIIKPTWIRLKNKLGLKDFSRASQTAAAIELLKETGAYAALQKGDIASAAKLASREWASLPASVSGQRKYTFNQVSDLFKSEGGAAA